VDGVGLARPVVVVSGSRIVVIGDVVNDIVVVPRGPVRPDTDTAATIRPRPGGSAANTATWLGSLGAEVDFIGSVGSADAEEHEQIFREYGVEPHLQFGAGLPTGTIVILVDGERRTMLTERGANAALESGQVTDQLLASAGLLHISGYSILDGFGVAGARDLITRATAAGVPVSITPGSAGYLGDFGVRPFLDAIEGATIVFPNLAEGRLMSGETDPQKIGAVLRKRFEVVVLTMGAEGLIVFEGSTSTTVPAPTVTHVVDPTGAGDAMAAGFLEHWVRSKDAVSAARAGAFVAARAIMLVGGRPPI
jgi:sugar/nucleoside kinase (ribokinase family)